MKTKNQTTLKTIADKLGDINQLTFNGQVIDNSFLNEKFINESSNIRALAFTRINGKVNLYVASF